MIHRATTREDLEAISSETLAVVFLSVEWSGPERLSRRVFSEFERHLAEQNRGAVLPFWTVNEATEDVADWLRDLDASTLHSSGAGAVAWLSRGRMVASEINAEAAGVTALLSRTLALLGPGS